MKRYEICISDESVAANLEEVETVTVAIRESIDEYIKKYGGDVTVTIEDVYTIRLTMGDTLMERIKLLSGNDLIVEYSTWTENISRHVEGINQEFAMPVEYTIDWYDMDNY